MSYSERLFMEMMEKHNLQASMYAQQMDAYTAGTGQDSLITSTKMHEIVEDWDEGRDSEAGR